VTLALKGKIGLRVHGHIGGFGAASSFSGQIEPMLDWRVGSKVSLQLGYRWLYSDDATGLRDCNSTPRSIADARLRPKGGYEYVQHS
jgi:hypothetical protein